MNNELSELFNELGAAYDTPEQSEAGLSAKIQEKKNFHLARLGNITASVAHKAFNDQSEMSLSDKQYSFMCELAAVWRLKYLGCLDALAEKEAGNGTGQAAQAGLDAEDRISELVGKKLDREVSNFQCTTLHPEIPNLGATPDGKCIEGEYFQYKTAVAVKNFVKFGFVRTIADLAKIDSSYAYQALCEMSVTGCEKYNFVYYCPYSDRIRLRSFLRADYLKEIEVFEAKIRAFLAAVQYVYEMDLADKLCLGELEVFHNDKMHLAATSINPFYIGETIYHDGADYLIEDIGFTTVKARKPLKKAGEFSKTLTTIKL